MTEPLHDAPADGHRDDADGLELLLSVLPAEQRGDLARHGSLETLLEVVLDLGRTAEARFPAQTIPLGTRAVTREDLSHVTARLGSFTTDNRAGIERTLHRVSAIRNRAGDVVGLTCRVGRAVRGTAAVLRDVIESGRSVLLLGPPGIGKTTLLRESARVLSDEVGRRVVVVDTSNEIGGDGDIPHPGIGRARRMQVASPERQHAVMIEAVENHMPEVVVIDEIGSEAEAAAARTIAERGVQLVATAHGRSLDNLLSNPTLADLLGGVHAVTLGDEEARRRHTQKTVLERRQAPTFDVLVEIESRERFAVHHDVAAAVDAFLRGMPPRPEIRERDGTGEVRITAPAPPTPEAATPLRVGPGGPLRIFPYAVGEERLERAIHSTGARATVARSARDADAILTLRAYARRQPPKLRDALARDLPVHMLRSGSGAEIERFLLDFAPSKSEFGIRQDRIEDAAGGAEEDAEAAARAVLDGGRAVELRPQPPSRRRLQHAIAERHGLASISRGREPNRRVVLLPSDDR